MACKSVIALAFLACAFAGSGEGYSRRNRRSLDHQDLASSQGYDRNNLAAHGHGAFYGSNPYPQSPAPLNQDGTVGHTAEYREAEAAHGAAIAQQLSRLQEAGRLAAAHPDLTPPPHGYSSGYNRGGLYNSAIGSGYSGHSSAYSSLPGGLADGADGGWPSNNYNPESRVPAPLNADGTVAHTAAYQSIAVAHQAEYERAAFRNRWP